ncbi:MAG: trypsin-like serine protease [Pseudomonadota bacterium]
MCQIATAYADGGGHWGTGVLVSPNMVLTAAHGVCPGREVITGSLINFNQNGEDVESRSTIPFRAFKQKDIIHHPEHGADEYGFCHGV